jgi:signal transduction histidine kinase
VFADETPLTVQGGIAHAPLNTSSIQFQVTPSSQRVRYRLEGVDEDWKERSEPMRFSVRFIDKDGDRILHHDFAAVQSTPGWAGSNAPDSFVARKEVLPVPENAEYVSVAVSSSGPADAVGVIAIRGITIRSLPTADHPGRWLMREGLGPDQRPIPWNQAGNRRSMGSIIHPEGDPEAPPTLVIVDDDITGHADIASQTQALPALRAGEQLEVVWQEAFSVGLGGPFMLEYERLPQRTTACSSKNSRSMESPPAGPPPSSSTSPGCSGRNGGSGRGASQWLAPSCGLWARAFVRRRIRRQLRHAEILSNERLRIARDLHDDLGTRLSHISLVGANAEATAADQETQAALRQIRELTTELVGALSESVWMLNPKTSNLESLINYLCRLVSELCRLAGIRCRIDDLDLEDHQPISHEFRHNFSLAVKETVNNALRHADASEILLRDSIGEGRPQRDDLRRRRGDR